MTGKKKNLAPPKKRPNGFVCPKCGQINHQGRCPQHPFAKQKPL